MVDGAVEREQRCETCRAFEPDDKYATAGLGTCHRHAPSPVRHVADSVLPSVNGWDALWPNVDEGDWCCDWLPIEAPR